MATPGFQALCRYLTRGHIRVIMYHRFSPAGENHARRLPAAEFDWQMSYLKRHHHNWTPDQQLNATASDNIPPAVITVDDGYADFATIAFPLLQKYNLTATVFVTTGFVAGETWFWWDRLLWLLESCRPGEQEFHFAGQKTVGDPSTQQPRWTLWHTIADHLSVIDDQAKEDALLQLAQSAGLDIPATAPAAFRAMSWDQVRELAEKGISFGAHTVNHPVLSRVSVDRSEREIRESGTQLAAATGRAPGWFCYPQGGPGDFLPTTVEQVRQAGYRGCYTAFPDPQHNGDPMTLPRYSISGDQLSFQWVMCGAEYLFMRWKTRNANPKGPA